MFPSLWHEGQSNVLLEAAMMNMTILCGSIHKNQLPSSLLYSSYLLTLMILLLSIVLSLIFF